MARTPNLTGYREQQNFLVIQLDDDRERKLRERIFETALSLALAIVVRPRVL